MTLNFSFLEKFYQIVCSIYDYFVLFADTIINKSVLQSYAQLTSMIQNIIGPPQNGFDLLNPLRVLQNLVDYVVISGIGNTPLANMPTITFLFSAFITFSLGIAVLKIFK